MKNMIPTNSGLTFFEYLFLYISTMSHGIVVVDYYGFLLLAVAKLHEGGTYLDAIVTGGTQCEMTQCDHSVGYGERRAHNVFIQ